MFMDFHICVPPFNLFSLTALSFCVCVWGGVGVHACFVHVYMCKWVVFAQVYEDMCLIMYGGEVCIKFCSLKKQPFLFFFFRQDLLVYNCL